MKIRLLLGILAFLSAPFLSAKEGIHLETFKGNAISPYIQDITDLSLTIYREYPYLYEGTEEEYMPFIEYYSYSQNGIACILFDNDKPIGVAIGMPMNEMREKYKQPLLNYYTETDFDSLFYLGEFLLLKEYRGQGFSKQMYLELEQQVRKTGFSSKIFFCEIDNYRSLDKFWSKLGFKLCGNLSFTVYWRNVSELEDSPHNMIYLMKSLQDN